jgi:hypothetical protein
MWALLAVVVAYLAVGGVEATWTEYVLDRYGMTTRAQVVGRTGGDGRWWADDDERVQLQIAYLAQGTPEVEWITPSTSDTPGLGAFTTVDFDPTDDTTVRLAGDHDWYDIAAVALVAGGLAVGCGAALGTRSRRRVQAAKRAKSD